MENFMEAEPSQIYDKHQKKTNVVECGLDTKLYSKRAMEYLLYGFSNGLILCLLLCDICNKCPYDITVIYILEYFLAIVFSLSTLSCFINYCMYTFQIKPLSGTKHQKKLLSFEDGDLYFKTIPDATCAKTSQAVATVKEPVLIWHSSFNQACALPNWSYMPINPIIQKQCSSQDEHIFCNCSSSCDFLENMLVNNELPERESNTFFLTRCNINNDFQINPPIYHPIPTTSLIKEYDRHNYGGEASGDIFCSKDMKHLPCDNQERYSPENPIFDNVGLQQYLKNIMKENNNLFNINEVSFRFNTNSLNPMYMYSLPTAANMQSSVYQLAPPVDTEIKTVSESKPEFFCIRNINGKSESIKHISAEKFTQYVGNLRIWMASTILNRLAQEFESIDESLKGRGILDIQIGSIALERLKKTVENEQFVNAFMPKLPLLVPFLEMSSNQEYLVQRIKDLSKGSCIAEYRWNSGAEYHGLSWDEHLPTDSAILFHLFCVYMDSQLVPLPQGDGRPFFSRYVVIGEEKRPIKDAQSLVQNKSGCAIFCTNILHPKFNFVSDGEIYNCNYDRNNLFHVIIQFIIYMRTHHNGYLEGVHLGRSGINIMCVIED